MRRLRWFAFWTLLGVVSGAQLHLANQRFVAHPPSWWQALATGLTHWYLWGLLALVVAWLGRRFQVDRASFGRHFFIHLGASLDIALLQLVSAVGIQDLLHAAAGRPYPFAQKLVDDFTIFFHWNVLIYWAIVAVVHALDYHRDLEERHRHAAQLETRLSALHESVAAGPEEPAVRRHPERLLVVDDGRRFFVRTADVDWIESARNYVRLHVGNRAHTVRTTLAALEARLDEARFRRISRSALVNLD